MAKNGVENGQFWAENDEFESGQKWGVSSWLFEKMQKIRENGNTNAVNGAPIETGNG